MFNNKVVIVTGSTSEIGSSIAIRFANEGAKLAITGHNSKYLEEIAAKCAHIGGIKPLVILGEFTNKQYLRDIVETTTKHYGKLDILVNNAGHMKPGTLEECTSDDYDLTFNVNVKAALFITQLAVKHLTETKGNIINISGLAGIKSNPGLLCYSMSKAALDQMTKCIALELAPKGIRVNSVNPGYMPPNKPSDNTPDRQEFNKKFANIVPLGRNCTQEDVVEAVVYLASEHAGFITGHLFPVDGGRGLLCPRPELPKY